MNFNRVSVKMTTTRKVRKFMKIGYTSIRDPLKVKRTKIRIYRISL